MKTRKKNIKNIDSQIIQYYLDELLQIKLLDKITLKQLHQNIDKGVYYNLDVLHSITKNILNDTSIN